MPTASVTFRFLSTNPAWVASTGFPTPSDFVQCIPAEVFSTLGCVPSDTFASLSCLAAETFLSVSCVPAEFFSTITT